jgi:hypothetical protein
MPRPNESVRGKIGGRCRLSGVKFANINGAPFPPFRKNRPKKPASSCAGFLLFVDRLLDLWACFLGYFQMSLRDKQRRSDLDIAAKADRRPKSGRVPPRSAGY